jgi:hypothetical protein
MERGDEEKAERRFAGAGECPMIVVTDIQYYEVMGDEHAIYRAPGGRPCRTRTPEGYSWKLPEVIREDIKGRRFIRGDKEIIVGLSDEVADVFHMQKAAWDYMESTITGLSQLQAGTAHRLSLATDKLESLGSASWRQRLKWLFTGIPT